MQSHRPVTSLFQQSWWLDAVAPGRWGAVEVRTNGQDLDAWMPYVIRFDKWGFKVIDMPQLTMTLGPWVGSSKAEHPRRILGHHLAMLGELADGLPKADLIRQRFAPSIKKALPFKQRGYALEVAYTYRIDDLTDEDKLWASLSSHRRRQIKKAAKVVEVEPTDDLDVFLRLNRLTFERQGMSPPYSDEYVRRVDEACKAHDAREILMAKDDSGNVHAAVYTVFDGEASFSLMSGFDSAYRQFGAGSLLTWEEIRRSAKRSKAFDFEGGTSENVAAFVSTYGAELVPYLVATKTSLRWRTLELGKSQVTSGAQLASSLKTRLGRSDG